ncbi:MAG: hypothetical protein ACYC67_26595 [Prosthecobacter sp.]
MSDHIGTFSLVRQAKPKSRWESPDIPKFDPNWVIKFYLPGQAPKVKSGPDKVVFPICPKCLALPLDKGGVWDDDAKCKCLQWPRKWATEFLKTQTHLLMTGALQELEKLRNPVQWTPLKKVLEVYEERGPDDANKRANYLRKIIEVPTGKAGEQMTWEDLTKARCFEFAALWQAAGRQGWLERGVMPADGWARLRADMARPAGDVEPERLVRAVDAKAAMKCNTSIRNYMNAAKSIFGQWSRDNYLAGLQIPPLEDFLSTKVKVQLTKGHREFSRADYLAVMDALPDLKKNNPRVWLVNQMLMRFGMRPEEVWPSRPCWLEKQGEGKKQRTRIKIINREDEGFTLKAGEDATERMIWVPVEMLAVMEQVKTEAFLIGGKHQTEARNLVEREHPQWLREIGVDVDRPNYQFRHFALAERLTSEGATKAAALGGHSNSQITESTYARTLGTLEPLSDEEMYRRLMEEG